ncbi:Ferric hydroxamate uptake [Serratia fonticola]|uniref:Ferric hydroxamate uptake n=1 Tax=Serratia fonticola TaxID=47917 RepID=A0A4U9TJH5_SERFO|nr:Ferric hydroxamate uptake [Serratia fonticola]
MASLWGQYKAGLGINLGLACVILANSGRIMKNTLRIPSVTLLDASVRMDLDSVKPSLKGAYVQLNANNLTDREYVAGCYGTGYCYWGAGRSVIATVGYNF